MEDVFTKLWTLVPSRLTVLTVEMLQTSPTPYFSAGQFKDGTDMTDEELNELAAEHPDLLYEKIYHYASD
jgi:hypothetical protein